MCSSLSSSAKFFLFRLTQQTCLIERKQPLQPALRPI